VAEPVPPVTVGPAVKPVSPVRSGLKAGVKTLGWALLFVGLDYLALREMQNRVEKDIDETRPHMLTWAKRNKARSPDKPVYLVVRVRFDDYTRYFPFLGWMPDRRLILAGVGVQDQPIDPPTTEVEDHSLDFFRPGKTTVVSYTELLIP
jgi:hypothetical protein